MQSTGHTLTHPVSTQSMQRRVIVQGIGPYLFSASRQVIRTFITVSPERGKPPAIRTGRVLTTAVTFQILCCKTDAIHACQVAARDPARYITSKSGAHIRTTPKLAAGGMGALQAA